MPIILSAPAKRKNGTKKHKPTPKAVNAGAVAAARAFGQTAYARGIGSAPAQDPMLRPLIGAASGDTDTIIAMLDVWAKEWNKAQRAASDAEIAALGLFPKQNGRRKNARKASLPPMRNNGSRSTTAAEIKAAVLAGADGSYLTDIARAPALRGVHFARIEAAAEALAKAGKVSYDGITVTRTNRGAARRNGSRSVVDPVAARELELYIENEANLVGPGNSLGANIMRMLAGRIVRGTYDSTKAWKAWVPLTTEGAKRYKREIGPINASKATRDAVATRLSEAFESEVRSGGIDPMKLLGKR